MSLLVVPRIPGPPLHRSRWLACQDALRRAGDQRLAPILILALLCSLLFYLGLGWGELYRTESLRAIIGAEFLRSGNWIVPTLYGEPLFTKPPGMYAAIALASWPFGHVNAWTARLPSAIAATLAVYLFYWYFGRPLGRRGGLVAALVLPMSFMWLDKSMAAEIDMLQAAWVVAANLFFLRALEIEEGDDAPDRGEGKLALRTSAWFWWLAALLSVAGGVLTKWTAPVFFYGMVVPLLWWRGRLRLLLCRRHLLGALLGAAICCGWAALAIGQAGWHAFYDTVGREALVHLSSSHQPRPYPWQETLAHPLILVAGSLPVSAFALMTLWPGFARLWDKRGRRLLQALHCWTWPNMIWWSLVPEHSPRHALPLFPGMAGLAALAWWAWITGRLRWPLPRLAPGKVLVGLVLLWLVVKLVFVIAVLPGRNPHRELRLKGELLSARVPPEKPLYLFRLKDEGIMFYYDRPVRRLADAAQLPSSGEPLYCILDEVEWRQWQQQPTVEAVLHLSDEQGHPIVLVRRTIAAGPGAVSSEGRGAGS